MSSFTTGSGLEPGNRMVLDLDDVESVLGANDFGNLSGLEIFDCRQDLVHDVIGSENTKLAALRFGVVIGVALGELAEVLARDRLLVHLVGFGFGGRNLGGRRRWAGRR